MKKDVLASLAGTFGSAFLWLLSFKIVAYWIGPAGIGLYSQLRQIIQAATVGATLGGTSAVVQGLAARDDEQERRRFRATASRLIAAIGLVVALTMFLAASQISKVLLSSSAPTFVVAIRWVSLAVLLNVAGTYLIAVLNGYRSYTYLALAQVAGPLALVAALLAIYLGQTAYRPEDLALLFVLCFGVSCLVAGWGMWRLPGAKPAWGQARLELEQARSFVKFGASSMLAALFTSLAMLVIRSWIIEQHGMAFAGLFDAAWTLTFNYATLLLTACSAIYLPLLAGAATPADQRAYMLKTAYLVLSAVSLVCYLMVIFKGPLFHLLYSAEFDRAGGALTILAVAVVLRGISWVYGTMIVATRDARTLLVSDFVNNLCLLLLARYCLVHYQTLESLAWAFVISNLLYLAFVIEYACRINPRMQRRQIWPLAAAAALPMIIYGNIQWLLAATALIISAVSWFAYKRVKA